MATTFNRAHSNGLAGATAVPLSAVVARLIAWRDARRTRNILSQLSADELDDIGLSRGDIEQFARGKK